MKLNQIAWGGDSAESDSHLLEYFLQTETYHRLIDKNKTIVIGRKGSGKSALRKKLAKTFSEEVDTHVINISPKYASIRNILNEKDLSEKFGEEIFFQHSWLRQIMLDSLCQIGHSAKGKYTSESLEYARSIAKDLNRTTKDLVENISEVLSKIKLKAGDLGELGLHLEKELRIVSEVDALEFHTASLCEEGAKFIIMIDDLDLGWDNSKLSNNLLLGLLSAMSYIKSISPNIHILIFLREDVYSILMEHTQHSDKFRNIERIRWNKENLIALLNERIKFSYTHKNETIEEDPFYMVFPETIGTHNTDNWLVERTLHRPRELIQLSRIYTEQIAGEAPDGDVLKNCEKEYSTWKLEDLCTEYSNQYPGLSEIFSFWKTNFRKQKYHLKNDDISDLVFKLFDELPMNHKWFSNLATKVDLDGFLSILYEIGFIGDFVQGGQGGSKTIYSFSENHEPRFEEVQIHPCFRKAVETVDRIRN